jgi:asparagine synthase (glutamine-hydrolysing)
MCGIAGIIQWDGAPVDALSPMLQVIEHRGPDDEGRFCEGPLAMGMRRLSIIDLSGGHQPICNEDGSIVAIFNGEIYNYIELREGLIQRGHTFATHSDTEVLVHLYEEEGPDFLTQLNGMFGFAIWDKNKKRLFVARDRLGIKPIYYAHTSRGLLFGSEMKSLMASGLLSTSLDTTALFDYLMLYYIAGEKSPFKEIKKLLPGHFLLMDESNCTIKKWWDLADYVEPTTLSKEDATQKLRETFYDAIKIRMRSDVPVGAYLSGGLDSSLVTVAATQQTDIPFSTFNIKFKRSEFDETSFAKAVATQANTEHHELEVSPDDALNMLPRLVWHLDEPNGDSAILPTYVVSEFAARHVKVALSGIGADEFFGGYPRYHRRLGKFERLGMMPKPMLQLMRPLFSSLKYEWGEKMDRMITPPPPWRDYLQKTHRFDEDLIRKLLKNSDYQGATGIQDVFEGYGPDEYVNRRMFADAHGYLPDQLLHLTDRMSMAPSLEARAPFLDYRIMELATSLPGSWKVSGEDWKIILKDALGDLVPPSIIKRPKWGFASPVGNWMSGKYPDIFKKLCTGGHLVRDGIIEKQALSTFLADPKTLGFHSHWLWAVCILELWYRIYGSGNILTPPSGTLEEVANS